MVKVQSHTWQVAFRRKGKRGHGKKPFPDYTIVRAPTSARAKKKVSESWPGCVIGECKRLT